MNSPIKETYTPCSEFEAVLTEFMNQDEDQYNPGQSPKNNVKSKDQFKSLHQGLKDLLNKRQGQSALHELEP